jgi:hypothetical protein
VVQLAGKCSLVLVLAVCSAFAAGQDKKKDKARELFEDICSYCHNLNKVQGHAMDKDEWRDLIKGMISEGAPVTDEEFSLIVDYLAKNFGKKDSEKR